MISLRGTHRADSEVFSAVNKKYDLLTRLESRSAVASLASGTLSLLGSAVSATIYILRCRCSHRGALKAKIDHMLYSRPEEALLHLSTKLEKSSFFPAISKRDALEIAACLMEALEGRSPIYKTMSGEEKRSFRVLLGQIMDLVKEKAEYGFYNQSAELLRGIQEGHDISESLIERSKGVITGIELSLSEELFSQPKTEYLKASLNLMESLQRANPVSFNEAREFSDWKSALPEEIILYTLKKVLPPTKEGMAIRLSVMEQLAKIKNFKVCGGHILSVDQSKAISLLIVSLKKVITLSEKVVPRLGAEAMALEDDALAMIEERIPGLIGSAISEARGGAGALARSAVWGLVPTPTRVARYVMGNSG